MLPFKLIYHSSYDLNFGDHVFPSRKYRLIRERMLSEGFASETDFESPQTATAEDLHLVHDPGWITRLRTGTLEYREILRLEVPYSRQMVEAFFLSAGGSVLAAKNALRDGIGYNIGGGFHHAFPGHGEGFCAIHDVAVAVRRLIQDRDIEKAMVVDTDVHQGNGTAFIFRDDPAVATLSIHQFNNYPAEKPPSTLDIHLPDGVGDDEYLQALRDGYLPMLQSFRPDFLFYIAGADPYGQDQLGGLALTLEGLLERDRLVIEAALQLGIPVAIALAGGYAVRVADTVTIHTNTAKAALAALRKTGWPGYRAAAVPPQA